MNRSTRDSSSGDERIDVNQDLHGWARKFDASPEQIKEAVRAVGDSATDVEAHLKGSRSTTNSERTHDVLASGGKAGKGSGADRPG